MNAWKVATRLLEQGVKNMVVDIACLEKQSYQAIICPLIQYVGPIRSSIILVGICVNGQIPDVNELDSRRR